MWHECGEESDDEFNRIKEKSYNAVENSDSLLVQSNVNTEKDDSSSDDKDIDCTIGTG